MGDAFMIHLITEVGFDLGRAEIRPPLQLNKIDDVRDGTNHESDNILSANLWEKIRFESESRVTDLM